MAFAYQCQPRSIGLVCDIGSINQAIMKKSIYGAYGIRGIWGETLTQSIVRDIVHAYAAIVNPTTVVCGRDARTSGPAIQKTVIETLFRLGVDVINVGVVPIDVLDFAIEHLGVDGGIHITASHNPPQWNGLKLRRAHARTLVGGEIKKLEKLVAAGLPKSKPTKKGKHTKRDISDEYANMVHGLFQPADRKLKIVVDPGNGATIDFVAKVLDRLDIQWSGIHMTMDGLFPDRGPDPKKPGALDALAREVMAQGADVGVAFDADGDRKFLVDEKGQPLFGETTGIMIARHLLRSRPGSAFVYNVVCSRAVPELITAAGGRAIRIGVGSVWTLPALKEHGALMGIETSGHYIQREQNYLDSGIIPMVLALNAIAATDEPLSSLVADLDPYYHEFIDLPHDDVAGALTKLRSNFTDGKQDELDGLTVEYPTWWFNARPSNTEPLLRLTVEAKTKEEMIQRREELLKLIRET